MDSPWECLRDGGPSERKAKSLLVDQRAFLGSPFGAGSCHGQGHSATAAKDEDSGLDLKFTAPELQDDEEAGN